MRKPTFCICETKDADQLRGKLVSAFVFATRIVQSLYFLNPKFQASSHLLCVYSLVCVRPGRKPRRPVFSERGSNAFCHFGFCCNLISPSSDFLTVSPHKNAYYRQPNLTLQYIGQGKPRIIIYINVFWGFSS